MAYRIVLPPELSSIHNVFHVSMLCKYIPDPSHVVEYESLHIGGDLSYQEQPVQILDRREQVLRSKTIPLVKVLWRNDLHEEATWETEKEMKDRYPQLFEEKGTSNLRD